MTHCQLEITVGGTVICITINESLFDALAGGEPQTDADEIQLVATKIAGGVEHVVAINGVYL
jgi:hypothetical protein